jgi:hypothetical protein
LFISELQPFKIIEEPNWQSSDGPTLVRHYREHPLAPLVFCIAVYFSKDIQGKIQMKNKLRYVFENMIRHVYFIKRKQNIKYKPKRKLISLAK